MCDLHTLHLASHASSLGVAAFQDGIPTRSWSKMQTILLGKSVTKTQREVTNSVFFQEYNWIEASLP